MKPRRVLLIIGLSVIAAFVASCLWTPELDRVRKGVEHQLPGVTFKKEVAFSLGPIALSLVKAALKLVPDTQDAAAYLKDIRKVEVAVYEAQNVPQDVIVRLPGRLMKLLEDGRWELAVKALDEGESTWILCRMDGDSIRGLYIVALDRDALVLVRVDGGLEDLLARAIRKNARPGDHALSALD